MTGEGKFAAGEKEDGGCAEGDEEVGEQPDECGTVAHAKCGTAVEAAGDALEDPDRGYTAEYHKR